MVTIDERMAVVETRLDNLATKADLERMKGELNTSITKIGSEVPTKVYGSLGLIFLGLGALIAILKYLG